MQIRVFLQFALLSVLLTGVRATPAQSARDGWAPALGELADVRALLDAGEGRVYVAARFDGATVSLRRFHPDGRRDTGFAERLRGGNIEALAIVDGRLWVGGLNLSIDGTSRGGLAVLDASGVPVNLTHPVSSGSVHAIEPDGEGGAWIGGEFAYANIGPRLLMRILLAEDGDFSLHPAQPESVASRVRALERLPDGRLMVGRQAIDPAGPSGLLRLDRQGRIDPSFNARLDATVFDVKRAGNGDLLVGGSFENVNGHPQMGYARLRPDGASSDDNVALPISCCVFRVLERRNGDVLVAGDFLSSLAVGDLLLQVPLQPTNGASSPFVGIVGTTLNALLELADGSLVIGGRFSAVDGVQQPNLARLLADGTVDTHLQVANDTGIFTALAVSEDGVWLGGDMAQVAGSAAGRLVKLDHRGRRAPAQSPALNRPPLALLPLDNDRLLVGGDFTQVGAQVASHLLLVENSSGTRQPLPVGADGTVHALVRQADGKILVGGAFNAINGVSRRAIARLNADLSLDTGFNLVMDPSAVVRAIAITPDGGFVLGGSFSALGIEGRQNLAKVRADGVTQALFTPNPNGRVDSLLVAPNGEVYVGGAFTSIGGQARSRVARLNADGSLASFAPTVNAGTTRVSAIALQADGRVLLGGNGGLLKRVEASGADDPGWSLSFTGSADGLSFGSDGRLWVIGSFSSLGGVARQGIARIAPPDRHAGQALAYSAALNRVFWGVRDTAPEVATAPRASVSFNRGQSFTPLPAMVRQSSLWRSSLALPLDTEVLLRFEAAHAAAPAGSGSSELRTEVVLFQSSELFADGFE